MPYLRIHKGETVRDVPFEGTPLLLHVLAGAGEFPPTPCGGKGTCGKCLVRAEGCLSGQAEKGNGMNIWRSCQTRLTGDAQVWLKEQEQLQHIALSGEMPSFALSPMEGGKGLAVDIGTTTMAAALMDLKSGRVLAADSMENPQRTVAFDIIGRIEAAMRGQGLVLAGQVQEAISRLLQNLGGQADVAVITGNTTMLYLLTGRDPKPLSHAPFEADCLFGVTQPFPFLPRAYLPRCISAFVGADIACAILASRMMAKKETSLLIDIGTNGEIALWHQGKLYCCATAAGPAFEGGSIRCGCGSIRGAIDRVWAEEGKLRFTVIGGGRPKGICGSGLLDAAASLLALGQIEDTGLMEQEVSLTEDIRITSQDIRSLQLAKGAIAAGLMTLLEKVGIRPGDVCALYLAGGFGKHINPESARAIGLIPAVLTGRTAVLGNAALTGAQMLLLRRPFMEEIDSLAQACEVVTLSGSPVFSRHYMECMMLCPIEA